MTIDAEKFEISLDGIIYKIMRSGSDKNIYRLSSQHGSYLIARDFYGIWVELTSKSGSASIPLTHIGQQIDNYYNCK
jgi:hypothetical protein